MSIVLQAISVSPTSPVPVALSGYYANPDNTDPRPLCEYTTARVKDMFGMYSPTEILRLPSFNGITMIVVQEEYDIPNAASRNHVAECMVHGFNIATSQYVDKLWEPKPIRGDVIIFFTVANMHLAQ